MILVYPIKDNSDCFTRPWDASRQMILDVFPAVTANGSILLSMDVISLRWSNARSRYSIPSSMQTNITSYTCNCSLCRAFILKLVHKALSTDSSTAHIQSTSFQQKHEGTLPDRCFNDGPFLYEAFFSIKPTLIKKLNNLASITKMQIDLIHTCLASLF